MKKSFLFAAALFLGLFGSVNAQQCYWVMLTDKAGTTFDPYTYFDSKAIERYQLNNADLYDISNYPLNQSYVSQIKAIVEKDSSSDSQSEIQNSEFIGESRWMNAVGIMATPEQAEAIRQLPFVKEVVMIGGDMQLTWSNLSEPSDACDMSVLSEIPSNTSEQLIRMKGNLFIKKGINGKGVRIAVFDGGFPQVNTHAVFQHLRDNGQIVKTWNFPNKKENVYGWDSHGLMTLSCITGIHQYQGSESLIHMELGLATGAEFLLARTEVNAEPFKEEVWWQMAVEWADKNGAQIISSSLGYGKDRYYTKDMNGQSYVAKAGNMAARKGILVCNSAGNEGDDGSWRTIITPSDADSVLCVGGITHSLTEYEHISFSSYGPSADGRQKPNVCAFGIAKTANTGSSNENTHYVSGTSFSCPLVAGFAACALQTNPKMTAMELFHEIEKSADLYPYCDYSFGYGVPQADYFTGDRKEVRPTFKFVKDSACVTVVPLKDNGKCRVFIKNSTSDGGIIDYQKIELDTFTTDMVIDVYYGEIITVNLNGYTESYNKNPEGLSLANPLDYRAMHIEIGKDGDTVKYIHQSTVEHFSTRLNESRIKKELYFLFGQPVNTSADELEHSFWSSAKRIGFRYTYHFTKAYGWGLALEYGHTSLRFGGGANRLDSLAFMDDDVRWLDKKVLKHKLNLGEFGVELYQRVRLRPGGIFHKGWHWDLGLYGNWSYNIYKLKGQRNGDIASSRKQVLTNLDILDGYRWNWGVTTRLSRDWFGIYARYRLNGIGKDVAADKVLMPRLEVGINLAI